LSRDDFYIPTDVDALRMENELLTFEVRFLKAQLSARETAAERSAAQLQSRLEESERRLGESEHSAAQLRDRLAEAERAEQDLVLLLRRLANSPLGWFLRLKQNFRILEQRYLDTDA
jgi:predicted  nucleic acid-binding Zn-ribbon protein